MLTGTISKDRGAWLAVCEIIGAFTQGKTRKEAVAMLADCIETKIDHLKVTVTEIGAIGPNSYAVFIDADKPAMLVAEVLCYQREIHKLTRADVARRGASSLDTYVAYEQGVREPSLSKLEKLLSVVAPEMMLSVGPRLGAAKAARPRRPAAKRKTKAAG